MHLLPHRCRSVPTVSSSAFRPPSASREWKRESSIRTSSCRLKTWGPALWVPPRLPAVLPAVLLGRAGPVLLGRRPVLPDEQTGRVGEVLGTHHRFIGG